MKSYPSISRQPRYESSVYIFEKLDGTNIRAEWSKKQGFYKFGTRKTIMGPDSLFAESMSLIHAQEERLRSVFTDQKWERCVCFFEFWGTSSFAGNHENEQHEATLIDVDVYRRGQLDPRDFVKLFPAETFGSARLIHFGFNKETEAMVRNGELPGQSFEGVVGKLPTSSRWQPPYMFKVKSDAWVAKVKSVHGSGAEELL